MRGKCSVFPDELRAPKMAVTADLFNFLNDMNNLTVDGDKLSPEEKKGILTIVSQKGNITLRQLAKELNVDEVDIKGYRIDKNQKAIFTEFKGYKKIKSILEKEGYSISLNDYEMLDRIIEILTNKKGIQERKDLKLLVIKTIIRILPKYLIMYLMKQQTEPQRLLQRLQSHREHKLKYNLIA